MKSKSNKISCENIYKRKRTGSVILHVAIIFLITVALLTVALYAAGYVLLSGPSSSLQKLIALSLRETSAIYWIPNLYMSDEEIEALYAGEESETENTVTNVNLVTISTVDKSGTVTTASASEDSADAVDSNIDPDGDGIDIIRINSGSYKGYMAIIYDPTRIIVGTSRAAKGDDEFTGKGVELTDLCEYFDAALGVNAGGFEDTNGGGNGGIPIGIVIEEGKITYGSASASYSLCGFDASGILICGTMTGQEALDRGIVWGCSFGPSLIINGEAQSEYKNLYSGVNPRTAIGQRADGAVLLLVIDGRQLESLGATYEDLINIMMEYGAINAFNLDGGSSSMMVYNGEILNNCASVYGPRPIPTSILVLNDRKEDGE